MPIVPIILLSFFSLSRLTLYSFAIFLSQIDFSLTSLARILFLGLCNDVITTFYALIPIYFIAIFIPNKIYKSNLFKALTNFLYFLLICSLSFLIVSEFTFWLEFGTRFNFIAVDYLVYTHEVIGNIRESYPLTLIFSLILFISSLIYFFIYSKIQNSLKKPRAKFGKRILIFILLCVINLFSFFFYESDITDVKDNYESELNKNGIYNLFSAFRHNSIDYFSFYPTRDINESLANLYQMIEPDRKNPEKLSRWIQASEGKKDYNVILITVESLSSSFLNVEFHGPLTGNINNLIKESVYFSNYYATGTRTVRGLEALILGIPPLPGQSIVRRPDNQNLFSLGSVLKQEGYDLKFIYGGYGYFDNMNNFFENNGFSVIDRAMVPKNEIIFENIWGISDEDLFAQVIKQADISYSNNKKFFSVVLTTSNHRPYTYPQGRINLPFSREGGVKYTDYAIGEFIKNAKTKPWFANTIFVISADHCAGTSGKIALPPEKYHIPLIIYAPNLLKPRIIQTQTSQIDVPPTILNLLNISYESKFFGKDAFKKIKGNAFISTFQKLGYMENNNLVVLSPGRNIDSYEIKEDMELFPVENNSSNVNSAIDYYQSAYYLYSKGLLKNDNKK